MVKWGGTYNPITDEKHLSFIFHFRNNNIKVGLVIEISEETQMFEGTNMNLFYQYGPGLKPKLLFKASAGASDRGDSGSNKKVWRELLQKLQLNRTTPAQFLAGIFSQVFVAESNHRDSDGTFDLSDAKYAFGLEDCPVSKDAFKIAQKGLIKSRKAKKRKVSGITASDPILLE